MLGKGKIKLKEQGYVNNQFKNVMRAQESILKMLNTNLSH